MLERLDVPEELARNTANVIKAGLEETGETLINLAMQRAGFDSLADVDILDVGCSTRFTQSIINRKIPIKSYFGLEVRQPVVEYLQEHVAMHDERFRYAHWNIHNALYNPQGVELSQIETLPGNNQYDLIWLFSVFTHLDPTDSLAMLKLLRKHIRKGGKLFFTAFVKDNIEGFEDKVKDQPMLRAHYGRKAMESMIEQSQWKVESLYDSDLSRFIQHHYVCSPA